MVQLANYKSLLSKTAVASNPVASRNMAIAKDSNAVMLVRTVMIARIVMHVRIVTLCIRVC